MIRKLFPIFLVIVICVPFTMTDAQSSSAPKKGATSTIQSIKLDQDFLVIPCKPGVISCGGPEPSKSLIIGVHLVTSKMAKRTVYRFTISGGKLIGEGRDVQWDFSQTPPGTYQIDVHEVKNGRDLTVSQSATVNVVGAICICDCLSCPLIKVNATDSKIAAGETVSVSASISGNSQDNPLTLNWTVSDGQIISGQGTEAILIRMPEQTSLTKIVVTLTIGGSISYCSRICPNSQSVEINVRPQK